MKLDQLLENAGTINVDAIKTAMRAHVEKPRRAVVNSESAFVTDMLRKMGETQSATEYWRWVTSYVGKPPAWVDQEIADLQKQLDAIDDQQTMPDWGIRGT